MSTVTVYIEKCREDVQIPTYAHAGDSGVDVRAAEDIFIQPGETKIVPTGIKVSIPNGYELQVRPRSGISFKTPLRISNAPGTIDESYKDEIGIIVTNTSNYGAEVYFADSKDNKKGHYQILKGDRIAQLVLQEVPKINFIEVDDVSNLSNLGYNRKSAYGESGVK